MLDGRLVCSCLVLAAEAEGSEITTIEGIADDGHLHPLQQKFLEHAALQCGICTPGFLVSAKNLLEKNPNPTEHEIRLHLAGNLCRCTGYDKIVRAVQDAAAELAHERSREHERRQPVAEAVDFKVIGTRPSDRTGSTRSPAARNTALTSTCPG